MVAAPLSLASAAQMLVGVSDAQINHGCCLQRKTDPPSLGSHWLTAWPLRQGWDLGRLSLTLDEIDCPDPVQVIIAARFTSTRPCPVQKTAFHSISQASSPPLALAFLPLQCFSGLWVPRLMEVPRVHLETFSYLTQTLVEGLVGCWCIVDLDAG